jgi:uncharacterized protein YggL (DUF469 family)
MGDMATRSTPDSVNTQKRGRIELLTMRSLEDRKQSEVVRKFLKERTLQNIHLSRCDKGTGNRNPS